MYVCMYVYSQAEKSAHPFHLLHVLLHYRQSENSFFLENMQFYFTDKNTFFRGYILYLYTPLA